jgi:integral membrane protein (TIGR01906 family)
VKGLKIAAQWLFILCLPILLVTMVIGLLVNSLWLYDNSAGRYGVAESLARNGFQMSDAEISGFYDALIHYYNSGEDYVNATVDRDGQQVDVLTPEDTQHFKDIKGLIRLDYGIFLGTFILCLAVAGLDLFFWRDRRRLATGLMGGGLFTLGLLLVLAVLDRTVGFDNLFLQFHYMFFNNMFWLVSGDNNMLLLFPENLFIDGSTIGFAMVGGLALVLGGAGWWLRRVSPARA